MTLHKRIRELTQDKLILEFCDFVLDGVDEGKLPDFNSLDLMSVPSLVPNIIVFDYRKGVDDGLLVKFSGTNIDNRFGQNIQGKIFEDVYTGHDIKDVVIELHHSSYYRKEAFYTRRIVNYDSDTQNSNSQLSTVVLFPCSSNGVDIDYGIGFGKYEYTHENPAPIYKLIGY